MKNKKLLLGIGLGVATLGAIYLFNKKKEKEETKHGFGGKLFKREAKVSQPLLDDLSSKESLGEMIVDLVTAYRGSVTGAAQAAITLSADVKFRSKMAKSGYGDISGDIIEMVRVSKSKGNFAGATFYKKMIALGYPMALSGTIVNFIADSFNPLKGLLFSVKTAPNFIKQLKELGY